ncbi:hypothetical protein [Acuticoccus sp. I52.16.1]|uniref:hypothetical protein n=1 Tax=Acuticoccus sp. I52.16.1 TaxID=2928472 RepID=UPI001FD1F146|nr:hypothetical protein [Acuticoccus sp. I52.16.1]UOM34971.1 hypothetical protein MRB58_01790 [Acuticoccus sp. I52.16.1]
MRAPAPDPRSAAWSVPVALSCAGAGGVDDAATDPNCEDDLALAVLTNHPGRTAEAAMTGVVQRLYATYGHGG